MQNREYSKKIFSYIFLFIFFAKMMITLSPLIIKHFDREIMNAVIMQLEIENHAKGGSDMSKELFKDYLYSATESTFLRTLQCLIAAPSVDNEAAHLRTFFPSVPTPPPNV
jgi:hypothetical protein